MVGRAGALPGARGIHSTATRATSTPGLNLTAAEFGLARASATPAMAWLARLLLAVSLGWLGAGAVLAWRRRPTAPSSAAAASWVAATRPWRAARDRTADDVGERALLVAVPGVLLLATRGVQTSFLAPVHLLVVLGAWLVLLGVGWALLRGRVPWGCRRGRGGVLVARCALALFAMSSTGPGGYWFAFWTEPDKRTAYVTVAVALFLWLLVAAAWALWVSRGRRRRRAPCSPPSARASPCRHPGALVGLERALTAWNDQVGLLPWGLSRILGITVYLGIPADTAWWAAALGAVVLVVGLLLALPWWSATTATEDAAEHVPDDAAGVEGGPLTRHRPTSPTSPTTPRSRCRARHAACRRASRERCHHRRQERGRGVAGARGASAEPAATTLQHTVGQPGEHHRREDREHFFTGRRRRRAAHGRKVAAPVDDLVLLVPEDVAGDCGAVLFVDRRQVGAARQQVVVVLAERLEDRARARGVSGVGLEATEQGREHRGGGRAHLVGGGPDLLRDLVGGHRAEDVVDCGHGVPFPRRRTCSASEPT